MTRGSRPGIGAGGAAVVAVVLVAAIVALVAGGTADGSAAPAAPTRGAPAPAGQANTPAPAAKSSALAAASTTLPVAMPAAAAAAASTSRLAEQIVADARLHGDQRAPPIDAPDAQPPAAQPWEVADPALFQAREQRMTAETHARFLQASEQRLIALNAAIDQMRRQGAPEAALARAEDKVRHLQAVHDAVARGEPLGAAP
jgi:hypothetical protein